MGELYLAFIVSGYLNLGADIVGFSIKWFIYSICYNVLSKRAIRFRKLTFVCFDLDTPLTYIQTYFLVILEPLTTPLKLEIPIRHHFYGGMGPYQTALITYLLPLEKKFQPYSSGRITMVRRIKLDIPGGNGAMKYSRFNRYSHGPIAGTAWGRLQCGAVLNCFKRQTICSLNHVLIIERYTTHVSIWSYLNEHFDVYKLTRDV